MSRRKDEPALTWDQAGLAAAKAAVKRDLDAATTASDPRSRLAAIFRRLGELAADDSDAGRLKRYVYAVSGLVHHERFGGLTPKDVKELVNLAYAILQAQQVRPRASRIAALYGDIHLIESQIYRKEGAPWRAAWEQQVALQLAGEFPSGGLGFQVMAMANRSLRLGHARLALAQLGAAEAAGGEHYDATYVIEATIWGLTLQSRAFLERLPRLGGMRRNTTLKPQRLGAWYRAGVVLQDCYDHGVPLTFRLRALGEVLEAREQLITVDKELLVLAAATRWLARSKSESLAVLVFSEYRALCRRLSDGASDDVLQVLSDIRSRPWLAVYQSQALNESGQPRRPVCVTTS